MMEQERKRDVTRYRPVISDIKEIISAGQQLAYNSVNTAMVMTYWQIGRRIVEQEQSGNERAECGKQLVSALSVELTKEFGKGFSERNLRNFRKFYILFPDDEIWQTRLPNLTWSHFCCLLRVPDEDALLWYLNEAANENWSVRTFDRNISTQYYYRLLQAPKKDAVVTEMKQKTATYQRNQFELLKNPVIAEFLGFKTEDSYLGCDPESAILTHISDFLPEMGRGFAFVARQQHIVTETEDYFPDPVFYNVELKSYVLIDLKMEKITHQDVGQIDMYVRMYDDLKRKEGDNPTIGTIKRNALTLNDKIKEPTHPT